jgi:hypothetical protein
MLATLRVVDSRSRDCGNDRGWLLRAQMLAISRAVDSRSRDCGDDEVFYSEYKCWQLYALQIPAQGTAGMTSFLQRVQMLAMVHAIDSRSRDCGNDEFLLCDQLSSRSSRKFRRGEITTLIRLSRNYPGSIACTNVGNFTRCRFPLRGLRE